MSVDPSYFNLLRLQRAATILKWPGFASLRFIGYKIETRYFIEIIFENALNLFQGPGYQTVGLIIRYDLNTNNS